MVRKPKDESRHDNCWQREHERPQSRAALYIMSPCGPTYTQDYTRKHGTDDDPEDDIPVRSFLDEDTPSVGWIVLVNHATIQPLR
jgi:hypothetical protein